MVNYCNWRSFAWWMCVHFKTRNSTCSGERDQQWLINLWSSHHRTSLLQTWHACITRTLDFTVLLTYKPNVSTVPPPHARSLFLRYVRSQLIWMHRSLDKSCWSTLLSLPLLPPVPPHRHHNFPYRSWKALQVIPIKFLNGNLGDATFWLLLMPCLITGQYTRSNNVVLL